MTMRHTLTVFFLAFLVLIPGTLPAFAARSGRFGRSCAFYQKKVAAGASVNERIYILNRILRKYRGNTYAIPLTPYTQEHHFLIDFREYLRQAEKGMQGAERRAALDTITRAYQNTGVNLSLVAAEYARLPIESPPPQPEPVVITTTTVTVPSEVLISTPAAITEPAAEPAPQLAKKRTAKYLGVSGTALGGYGLYGYQMLVNFTDRFSLSAGTGINTLLATPNAQSTASQSTMIGLLRYGENIYIATGFLQRTARGEAVAGTNRVSGSMSCSGIPIVIGVETGTKRGIFLSVEWAYIAYSGAEDRTLTATDPATGTTAELKLEAPANGTWFGIGLGFYLF